MGRCGASIALRGATALGIALGLTAFPEAGAYAAQHQVAITVTYACAFPMVGNQPVPVNLSSNIPTSIAVGQSTAKYSVDASVNVPAGTGLALRALGVSIVSGTVDGQALVEAPQGTIAVTIPFTAKVSLPLISAFTTNVIGTAPVMTFTKPGTVRIIVGNLTAHLVLTDSNGKLAGPGKVDFPCSPTPNQNEVAATVTVTGAPSPTSSSSATPSPGHSSSPSAHPSPSGPTSSASSSTSAQPTGPTPLGSVVPAADPSSSGGRPDWGVWLGALAAVMVVGAVWFRFGPRLFKRER